MKTDLISIVVPLFNREVLVKETIESVQAQTYPNWEMLIIDDGSQDASFSVAESYMQQDDRIKLFKRNRDPKGVHTCRTMGLEIATGEYLMFLDSDDLLEPNCLERRLAFAKKQNQADFWIFKTAFFDHFTKNIISVTPVDKHADQSQDEVLRQFFGNNPFWYYTAAPFYRREMLVSEGFKFDNRILRGEDKDFMARVLLSGHPFAIGDHTEPDMLCRLNSSTSTGASHNQAFLRNYAEKARSLKFHLENTRDRLLAKNDQVLTDYINRNLLNIFYFELLSSQLNFGEAVKFKPAFVGANAGAFSLKKNLLTFVHFLKINKMPKGYKLVDAIIN
jgi:glycosyltransferase involved in cell wall biosynthesis